jgi:hypothetical protein
MGTARVPIRPSPYWPHPPHVKQAAFLSLPHLEALYGGAAGGGKSDALLMAALQYADCPGYAALLLRKTYPELAQPGGLIDRSQDWLAGTDAKWNEQKHRWTFPSGAVLEFGYLHRSTDRFRYQGAELDFIGFDELTHFDESDFRYLFSRLRRREGSPIPPRMRAASNPGGRGHRWVKRRFIDKLPAEDDPADTPEMAAARIFIPAKLADNPSVDQQAYLAALAQLDPQERAQLVEGDWSARAPGNWVFDHQAIDAVEALGLTLDRAREKGKLPAPDHIALGVDWGDFATVGEVIWPLSRGGVYVPPGEVTESREDLEEITDALLEAAANYPYWLAEERYDASFAQSNRTFAKLAQRRLGAHNPMKRRGRPNTYPVAFGEYKMLAIKYLRLLMSRTLAGKPDRVLAVSPRNEVLLDQLRDYQEDDFGKPIKGGDDAVDALIAGVAPLARKHRATLDAEMERAKVAARRSEVRTLTPSQVA